MLISPGIFQQEVFNRVLQLSVLDYYVWTNFLSRQRISVAIYLEMLEDGRSLVSEA